MKKPTFVTCPRCDGYGRLVPNIRCTTCDGQARIQVPNHMAGGANRVKSEFLHMYCRPEDQQYSFWHD